MVLTAQGFWLAGSVASQIQHPLTPLGFSHSQPRIPSPNGFFEQLQQGLPATSGARKPPAAQKTAASHTSHPRGFGASGRGLEELGAAHGARDGAPQPQTDGLACARPPA